MEEHSAVESPTAVDLQHIWKRSYALFLRRAVLRVCVFAALCLVPVVLYRLGVPDGFWMGIFTVAGVAGLVFTAYNFLPVPFRLNRCRRVIGHYPPEPRPFARHKDSAHSRFATVFTFVIGEKKASRISPRMWGVEVHGRSRWPAGAEEEVWIAGDLPFGGVMVVPSSDTMLLMRPAKWEKALQEREQAGPERAARAKQAGLGRKHL